MKRVILGVPLIFLLLTPARAQYSSSTLHGVDVYRSSQVTVDEIRQKLGPLLTSYVRLRYERIPRHAKEMERLREQILTLVRGMGRFAYADIYFGEYANSAGSAVYVTFDLVDAADAAKRMPFRPAPHGHVADPGGLIAAWQQLDALGTSLLTQGLLAVEDRPNCSAFYCKWGGSNADMAALDRKLSDGAETNKDALKKLALQDSDPGRRAAALYVLSYIHDGAEVAKLSGEALGDPAPEPRSAALGILADIVVNHKETIIDIGQVLAAMDYPTVTDRSKALGLMVSVADTPSYKSYLRSRASALAMPLLRLDQPSDHDLAFTLLSLLSGETYGARDYDSWQYWVDNESTKPLPPEHPAKKNGR